MLSVIPAKAGIQESWMPDRVRHDNAREPVPTCSSYGGLVVNKWVQGILSSISVSFRLNF